MSREASRRLGVEVKGIVISGSCAYLPQLADSVAKILELIDKVSECKGVGQVLGTCGTRPAQRCWSKGGASWRRPALAACPATRPGSRMVQVDSRSSRRAPRRETRRHDPPSASLPKGWDMITLFLAIPPWKLLRASIADEMAIGVNTKTTGNRVIPAGRPQRGATS